MLYKAITIDSPLANVKNGKRRINFPGLGPGLLSFVIVLKIELLNLR